MKQPLKILSIDFDFFQETTHTIINNAYPDSLDMPTELSSLIWATHYANPDTETLLNQVTFPQQTMDTLLSHLDKHLTPETPVMVRNSHKHIYPFTFCHYDTTKYENLQVINLDMHHDAFTNDRQPANCGNWTHHLRKYMDALDETADITWIPNEISEKSCTKAPDFIHIVHDLDILKDFDFDLLYICRSDNWLPPHLDNYFQRFIIHLKMKSKNIHIEPDVTRPRTYKQEMQQLRTYYESNIERK